MTTARDLLLKHYLDWQRDEGERKTFIQFAQHVGVSNKQLEHVFNGRRDMSEAIARRLALALNDYRFYDIAGLDRPSPLDIYIEKYLGRVDTKAHREIADVIAKYVTEPPPTDDT